jgi:hypothetical protein
LHYVLCPSSFFCTTLSVTLTNLELPKLIIIIRGGSKEILRLAEPGYFERLSNSKHSSELNRVLFHSLTTEKQICSKIYNPHLWIIYLPSQYAQTILSPHKILKHQPEIEQVTVTTMIQTFIREVRVSNLCRETCYSESDFSSVPSSKFPDNTSAMHP